jgi:PAB1-binding protein PBP1
MSWTSTKKKKGEKTSTKASIIADIDLADNEDDVLSYNEMELIHKSNKTETKKLESKSKPEQISPKSKSDLPSKTKQTKKETKPTKSSSRFVISIDDDDDLIEDIDKTPTKKQKIAAKTLEAKKKTVPPPSSTVNGNVTTNFSVESTITKFRALQENSSPPAPPPQVPDTLMWVEKYQPRTEVFG